MARATFEANEYQGSGPENYERYFVPAIGAPMAKDLVAVAALKAGERALDVACGTGVVTRLVAERVGKEGTVAGLDVNPGMLAVARSATPEDLAINWYEARAEAMPLPDGAFDVVLCQMGLQFVSNKLQALKEMRRILAPGGRVVLNLPGPTPARLAEMADALARYIDPKCAGFVQTVFSMHDGEALHSVMSEAGFTNIDIQRSQKALRLPEPEEFLWQYIHSTPLAGLVGAASDEQRSALDREIRERWQPHVADGSMTLEVGITTACAT